MNDRNIFDERMNPHNILLIQILIDICVFTCCMSSGSSNDGPNDVQCQLTAIYMLGCSVSLMLIISNANKWKYKFDSIKILPYKGFHHYYVFLKNGLFPEPYDGAFFLVISYMNLHLCTKF